MTPELTDERLILEGIPVVPNEWLSGMKIAHKMRGVVYVSPAMYSLMKSANQHELRQLLMSIQVRDHDPTPQHDLKWWADTAQIMMAKAEAALADRGGA